MSKAKKISSHYFLTVFIHIVIWLLVLHLEFNLLGLVESFMMVFVDGVKFIDEAFIIIPTLVLLFYLNSHFLIPKYLNKKSWWKYLLALCLSFLALFYAGVFIGELSYDNGYDSEFDDVIYFFDHSLILHLIVVGISTSLGISKIAMKNAQQKELAQEKQKAAELKYLNAQFNPHFLHNTLNGIYAQAVEEDAHKTTEAILKLSEIMRYPINEGLKNKVSLHDEISFVENYIALQKIRLGNDYPITFEKKGNLKNIEVIPFLLMPFVENSFKYGVSQRDKTAIHLEINSSEKHLIFKIENNITKTENIHSHLIGIENVKLRLDIVYGKNYSLELKETDNKYFVELKINFHQG